MPKHLAQGDKEQAANSMNLGLSETAGSRHQNKER
jgi:hypothetical protein